MVMAMEESKMSLESLSMDELSGVINIYPWFGAARRELCERMVAMGGADWGMEQYADSALYVVSREIISDIFRNSFKVDYSDKDAKDLVKSYVEPHVAPEAGEAKRSVRVVGGDFFSQADYDSVRKDEDNAFSNRRFAFGEPGRSDGWMDSELGFCTETLAGIYAEQGYYAEAKKIYSRLMLRYPEKSAYFASLIGKIRQEN